MTLLFLGLAAFLSSIISGVFGMAGGITLLAAMTLVMPLSAIVPIHGATQLVSNFSRTVFLFAHVNTTILKNFALGIPFGGAAGYLLLSRIERPEWFLAITAGLLIYTAFKPKKIPGIHMPNSGFSLLGLTAGMMGCLVGATGPLLAPFFIRKDLTKESIVATKAACQILVHIVKIPVFVYLAFPYADYIEVILVMALAVLVGTKIGTKLLGRISIEGFYLWMRILMTAIAFRLIYRLLV